MLATLQAYPDVKALVSGVTTVLLLPIGMFKKRKENWNRCKDQNLCGVINVLMMVAFVRTLDQSRIRRAPPGCYQLQGNLMLCPSESPQKPSKDKRTELKLLPPRGVPRSGNLGEPGSPAHQKKAACRINRRLLGPADFQPPENNDQPFTLQKSVMMLKLRQQPRDQAPTLTGPVMHLRPRRVLKRGWQSSATTELTFTS